MSLGSFLKGAGKVVGKVAKAATTYTPLRFAPIAPLIRAGGDLAAGENLGNTLKDTAKNQAGTAAMALAAAPLAGGGGIAGLSAGDLLKKAVSFGVKNPELILGGIGAVQGAKQQAKAGSQMDEALKLAQQDYESRAPLRAEALKRALALTANPVDLSSDFADAGNPYSPAARRDALAKATALGGTPKLGTTPPASNLSLQRL